MIAGAGDRAGDGPGRRTAGQGVVELGLVLAIAAIVAMVALVLFGPQLAAILDLIGAQAQPPT